MGTRSPFFFFGDWEIKKKEGEKEEGYIYIYIYIKEHIPNHQQIVHVSIHFNVTQLPKRNGLVCTTYSQFDSSDRRLECVLEDIRKKVVAKYSTRRKMTSGEKNGPDTKEHTQLAYSYQPDNHVNPSYPPAFLEGEDGSKREGLVGLGCNPVPHQCKFACDVMAEFANHVSYTLAETACCRLPREHCRRSTAPTCYWRAVSPPTPP